MLDLENLNVVVTKSVLEYICEEFVKDLSMYYDYQIIVFISHDDKIYNIDIIDGSSTVYHNLKSFNETDDLGLELNEFLPVKNVELAKYFKLYTAF